MLPTIVDRDTYWNSIYAQKLPFWQEALTSIADQNKLSTDGWQRAALGRNVVFLGEQAVIKLGPPSRQGEMAREGPAATQGAAQRRRRGGGKLHMRGE